MLEIVLNDIGVDGAKNFRNFVSTGKTQSSGLPPEPPISAHEEEDSTDGGRSSPARKTADPVPKAPMKRAPTFAAFFDEFGESD